MTRSDRLDTLARTLRDGYLHRAGDLARDTGVSPRTIYRDMDRLRAAGLPVAGTPGHGYRITTDVALPPLALTRDELEALHLGLAAVGAGGDADLARAARRLSGRIDAALSFDTDAPAGGWGAAGPAPPAHLGPARAAIRARQKLRVTADGMARRMRPLALDYLGRVWTLSGWCETTGGFVTLRLDRIDALAPLPGLFTDEPGRSLADMP